MNLSNWKKAVKERDGYACRDCGATMERVGSKNIHAHHEVPLAKGGKNELSNGLTLCNVCHRKRHKVGILRREKYITPAFLRLYLEKQLRVVKAGGNLLNFATVARETGLPAQVVRRYARGEAKQHKRDHINRLCAYFECSINELLGIDSNV